MKLKSSQRKSLAAVPTAFKGQERRFAQSVSESLDTLSGRRGNAIDRAVTFRDLFETGVLKLSGGALSDGGVDVINPNDSDSTPNGPIELPTKPTNLTASGGFNSIFLGWVLPPYSGHDYIEIFRLATNNVVSAEAAGPYTRYYGDQYFYTDLNVGSQETWYYWVRAVNKNGIAGPFNQSSGTSATSALDYLFVSGLIDDILDDDVNSLGLNTSIEAIENDITTVNTTVSGLSSTVTTLNSTVNGQSTSIQTNASTIDGIQGKYSVKVDNNGHVSGFGLISQANDHSAGFVVQPTSSFVINSDRFAIAAPYNSNSTANSNVGTNNFPFKVLTTATTLVRNGSVVKDADGNNVIIDAGVYIDDAFIHNAQITTANIGQATITSGHIFDLSATRISSGNINIDNSNNIAIFQGKRTLSHYDAVLQKNIYVPNFSSTASGFALGNNNGNPYFHIGNSTNYLKFDGSTMQVTGASITDLSVTTLKIGINAVTVPDGEDASGLSINVGGSFVNVDSGYNYLSDWDANSVPSSFLITGNVQFVGTNTLNQTSRPATAGIRFAWDWKTNLGGWSPAGVSEYNKTIGQQSLAQTFGGQAVSTAKVNVPSWSRGMRIRIQARNDASFGGSGSTSRKLTGYGYFVVAAKR